LVSDDREINREQVGSFCFGWSHFPEEKSSVKGQKVCWILRLEKDYAQVIACERVYAVSHCQVQCVYSAGCEVYTS